MNQTTSGKKTVDIFQRMSAKKKVDICHYDKKLFKFIKVSIGMKSLRKYIGKYGPNGPGLLKDMTVADANANSALNSKDCVCMKGYTGDGLNCFNVDECAAPGGSAICGPKTVCSDTPGSFTCACKTGYQGNPPTVSCILAEQIACNFLSIPDLTTCLSTVAFYGGATGSTIPSEIALLTNLTYLFISNNRLKGTIPSEIGKLTRLTYLDFSINELTGTIQPEIGKLTQLTFLYFYRNALAGTMPSSLCQPFSTSIRIGIDCDEIACASGCCASISGVSCG
jgi:hypothetical protein